MGMYQKYRFVNIPFYYFTVEKPSSTTEEQKFIQLAHQLLRE